MTVIEKALIAFLGFLFFVWLGSLVTMYMLGH